MNFYLAFDHKNEEVQRVEEFRNKVCKETELLHPKVKLNLHVVMNGGDVCLIPMFNNILKGFDKYFVYGAFSAGFSLMCHLPKEKLFLHRYAYYRQHSIKVYSETVGAMSTVQMIEEIKGSKLAFQGFRNQLLKKGVSEKNINLLNSEKWSSFSANDLAKMGIIYKQNIFE